MKRNIHILGASGSGTTTIAGLLCRKLGYTHFDSDSYFWMPTADPFTVQRPRGERLELLKNDLSNTKTWILSGSLTGWGDELIPFFDLVIFVYVPQDIRLGRLKRREYERYGDDILIGGVRHASSKEFLEWAATYDSGSLYGRSLAKHEKWLEGVSCPILRIENDSLAASVDTILKYVYEHQGIDEEYSLIPNELP